MKDHAYVELELEEICISATVHFNAFTNSMGGGQRYNMEFDDAEVLHVEIDEAHNEDGAVAITPELLDKYEEQIIEEWKRY
jgi:hypothetical protein